MECWQNGKNVEEYHCSIKKKPLDFRNCFIGIDCFEAKKSSESKKFFKSMENQTE